MALPVLPAGFNYDLVNTDVLLHRVSVRDGALVLPEGGRYRLLVLPPELKAMSLTLARKLQEFVAQGDAVVMRGATAWRHRRSSKIFATPKIDFWRFRNGKAIEFFEYFDTAGALEAATLAPPHLNAPSQ